MFNNDAKIHAHNYVNSKGFDNESLYSGTPTKAKEELLCQFVLKG